MWKKFLRWFRSKWDVAEEEIEEIWDDVRPGIEAIAMAGGKKFLDIVREAVYEAAAADKSGAEKFIMVSKQIKRETRAGAKDIAQSTINLAIEMVYARYKNEAP